MQKLTFLTARFEREGGAPGQNFFLTWSALIRRKTPWQTKKSNGTSPRSYKFFFIPQHEFWMKFYYEIMKYVIFWPNFEMLYLPEYFIKFHETASPDMSGMEGPHHVSRNFGNNFYPKFQQQLQIWKFFFQKNQIFFIFEPSLLKVYTYIGGPPGRNVCLRASQSIFWKHL